MHKTIFETSSAHHPNGDRLLARVLAEDLKRVWGQVLAPPVEFVITGEVRRDWSEPEFEGYPSF